MNGVATTAEIDFNGSIYKDISRRRTNQLTQEEMIHLEILPDIFERYFVSLLQLN